MTFLGSRRRKMLTFVWPVLIASNLSKLEAVKETECNQRALWLQSPTPRWCRRCCCPLSWTRPCPLGLSGPRSRWWSGRGWTCRLPGWSDPWSPLWCLPSRPPGNKNKNKKSLPFQLQFCSFSLLASVRQDRQMETLRSFVNRTELKEIILLVSK